MPVPVQPHRSQRTSQPLPSSTPHTHIEGWSASAGPPQKGGPSLNVTQRSCPASTSAALPNGTDVERLVKGTGGSGVGGLLGRAEPEVRGSAASLSRRRGLGVKGGAPAAERGRTTLDAGVAAATSPRPAPSMPVVIGWGVGHGPGSLGWVDRQTDVRGSGPQKSVAQRVAPHFGRLFPSRGSKCRRGSVLQRRAPGPWPRR